MRYNKYNLRYRHQATNRFTEVVRGQALTIGQYLELAKYQPNSVPRHDAVYQSDQVDRPLDVDTDLDLTRKPGYDIYDVQEALTGHRPPKEVDPVDEAGAEGGTTPGVTTDKPAEEMGSKPLGGEK